MSQIIKDLTEISRCGAQYRSEQLSPMGLKGCHASYLVEICKDPGISQDQLAQRICINKSNVARQAAFLEEAGFLQRTPSPKDKRVMQLFPTEKATALLPEIRSVLKDWEERLTEGLTAAEIAQMTALLAKMKGSAAEWMEGR